MNPDKFQNKYRVSTTRLANWDYSWAGAYFITICTQNREYYFGDFENGKMKLSGNGVIADLLWYEIKNHAKNIELGEFVIMPNHLHGILILNNDNGDGGIVETGHAVVETGHALSLQRQQRQQPKPPQSNKIIGANRFQNIGKNTISSIIGSYKSAVTKHAHRLGYDFGWQTRFYDHIIRDEKSYKNISDYIFNNPLNWNKDRLNPQNQIKENNQRYNSQWNRR